MLYFGLPQTIVKNFIMVIKKRITVEEELSGSSRALVKIESLMAVPAWDAIAL
jgi:hypothetical protein